jgi:hypothetical protein
LSYQTSRGRRLRLGRGRRSKLELDDQERRAVGKSLAERKARLIEDAEDTTRSPVAPRSAMLELSVIGSILGKLRPCRGGPDWPTQKDEGT